jgi:hypothetical protein
MSMTHDGLGAGQRYIFHNFEHVALRDIDSKLIWTYGLQSSTGTVYR